MSTRLRPGFGAASENKEGSPTPRLTHFKCMGGKLETKRVLNRFSDEKYVFIGKFDDFGGEGGKRESLCRRTRLGAPDDTPHPKRT